MPRSIVLVVLMCVAVTCSENDKPAPPSALLELPEGRLEITVEQRSTTRVAGSNSGLILRVGDITGGRVTTSLIAPPFPNPLQATPMAAGDEARFSYGDGEYVLSLLKLNNALVGDDLATFEITRYSSVEARPRKPLSEQERIQKLIAAIDNLEDAKFIRNGTAYGPTDAAAHIRSKLQIAGNRIKTADQFIEHLATRSSQSGEPYVIRFDDGREVPSAEFLRDELKKFGEHAEK